jgi:hypothetical protein
MEYSIPKDRVSVILTAKRACTNTQNEALKKARALSSIGKKKVA